MSDYPEAERYEHAGCVIRIIYDEDPINPREDYEHQTVMFCKHRDYQLGDKDLDIDTSECHSLSDVHDLLVREYKARIILPLVLLDHSGISMRVGSSFAEDPGGWDTSQVGFIFQTAEGIREQFGVKRVGKKTAEQALKGLYAEVNEYDSYLTGDVYGYVVERDEELVDSCWGFVGFEYIEDMKKEANAAAEREQRAHADYVGRL